VSRPAQLRRILFVQRPDLVDAQRATVEEILQRAVPGAVIEHAGEPGAVPEGARFDAIIAPTLPWLPEVMARVRDVRWVHFLSAGVDRIWQWPAELWDGVLLTKSAGVHVDAMSEYALGAMLYFVKRLGAFHDQQRQHTWRRFWLDGLAGKTLVILGLGAIGQAIARRARSFDMRLLGASRGGRPVPEVERVVTTDAVGELLPEADFLVVCVPLTPATRGMVDAGFLSRLKSGAVLVDVSRGGVVRERDLVDALASGRLGGAALDVFEEEPLAPDSPLWDVPNLLVTPHVAGTCPGYLERALGVFLRNWESLSQGGPPVTEVDRTSRY